MPTKGRPVLKIRVNPGFLALLQERAEKRTPGLKSGAAALAREVLYRAFGFVSDEEREPGEAESPPD